MKKNYLWTSSKARLELIKTNSNENINWIFLPGGPGLGSESLRELTYLLHPPGNTWHLDLPGDGSNVAGDFSDWKVGLIEAVSALNHVILVAHSTGGMYGLATPELEDLLSGLVLIDSAPDAAWQHSFAQYIKQHPIAELEKLQMRYAEQPNNHSLKQLILAFAPYLFTENYLKKGTVFIGSLTSFNFISCEWSTQHFDSTYEAQWIPKSIPTLIIAGDEDHITPLHHFSEAKKFQRDNIEIKTIHHAGHFPWIENPQQVKEVFADYYSKLKS